MKDNNLHLEGRVSGNTAAQGSDLINAWQDAGLSIAGRTNFCECAANFVTSPVANGAIRNPWDTDHAPAGSIRVPADADSAAACDMPAFLGEIFSDAPSKAHFNASGHPAATVPVHMSPHNFCSSVFSWWPTPARARCC